MNMTRERMIELTTQILLCHDMTGASARCICGQMLWGEGKVSMSRHRAEVIADVLEAEEKKWHDSI